METEAQHKINHRHALSVYIILILMTLFIFSFVQLAFMSIYGLPTGIWIGLVITELSYGGFTIFWLKVVVKGELSELGLKIPSKKWLFFSLIIAPGLYLLAWSIIIIQDMVLPIPAGWYEAYEKVLIPPTDLGLVIWITIMWVVAPCEELLFRGFVQNGLANNLEERGSSPYIAPIITGVLFGIFHLDPYRMFPVAVIGIIIGLVYYKTNNSLPCVIITHGVYNSVPYIILLFL